MSPLAGSPPAPQSSFRMLGFHYTNTPTDQHRRTDELGNDTLESSAGAHNAHLLLALRRHQLLFIILAIHLHQENPRANPSQSSLVCSASVVLACVETFQFSRRQKVLALKSPSERASRTNSARAQQQQPHQAAKTSHSRRHNNKLAAPKRPKSVAGSG